MSLELASFIKDLVATNPQGTDPKSQGDDHLRLIKGVLQSQFSGFTEGAAITLKESELNAALRPQIVGLGGLLSARPVGNIDTLTQVTQFYGVAAGTTGTAPPNGFQAGDMLLHMAYDAGHFVQTYYEGNSPNSVWVRRANSTTWTTWQPLYEETARQAYAFGSGYSSATGAGFRRINKMVTLEGAIQRSSPIGTGQTIATLPVGFRPQFETGALIMAQYSNLATQAVNCQILTTGVIQTSYVVTIGGTPSGTCSFWLNAQFEVAPL